MTTRISRLVRGRPPIGSTVFFLAVLGWAGASHAWPIAPTREEQAILPAYCAHTLDGYGPQIPGQHERWKATYGEAFIHFHHYCYAFVYLMRADRHSTPTEQRRNFLRNASGDIDYVLTRMPPDHVLQPELLTKQGMIRRRLGNPEDGIPFLKKASELNPRYWRAYLELATTYLARNQIDEAREALRSGLVHAPESRALASMLNDLEKESSAARRAPGTSSK